eukprot:4998642-Alexandrium_andersonii.AAC.1
MRGAADACGDLAAEAGGRVRRDAFAPELPRHVLDAWLDARCRGLPPGGRPLARRSPAPLACASGRGAGTGACGATARSRVRGAGADACRLEAKAM